MLVEPYIIIKVSYYSLYEEESMEGSMESDIFATVKRKNQTSVENRLLFVC